MTLSKSRLPSVSSSCSYAPFSVRREGQQEVVLRGRRCRDSALAQRRCLSDGCGESLSEDCLTFNQGLETNWRETLRRNTEVCNGIERVELSKYPICLAHRYAADSDCHSGTVIVTLFWHVQLKDSEPVAKPMIKYTGSCMNCTKLKQ